MRIRIDKIEGSAECGVDYKKFDAITASIINEFPNAELYYLDNGWHRWYQYNSESKIWDECISQAQ